MIRWLLLIVLFPAWAMAVDPTALGRLPVLHEGRIKPLSTLAALHFEGDSTATLAQALFAPDQAMTRRQLGFLVKKAMPDAYDDAFADTPQDRQIVQRRDLSRVFYVLLKKKFAI